MLSQLLLPIRTLQIAPGDQASDVVVFLISRPEVLGGMPSIFIQDRNGSQVFWRITPLQQVLPLPRPEIISLLLAVIQL